MKGACGRLALGADALWVTSGCEEDTTVLRIDPHAGRVVAEIDVGGAGLGIALGFGSVWAVVPTTGTLVRIDPKQNAVAETVSLDAVAFVAVGHGALWVTNDSAYTVLRIAPSS